MQQDMRVTSNGEIGQTPEALDVEIAVDPVDLPAGSLLDDAKRTAGRIGAGLVEETESHRVALSSSA